MCYSIRVKGQIYFCLNMSKNPQSLSLTLLNDWCYVPNQNIHQPFSASVSWKGRSDPKKSVPKGTCNCNSLIQDLPRRLSKSHWLALIQQMVNVSLNPKAHSAQSRWQIAADESSKNHQAGYFIRPLISWPAFCKAEDDLKPSWRLSPTGSWKHRQTPNFSAG